MLDVPEGSVTVQGHGPSPGMGERRCDESSGCGGVGGRFGTGRHVVLVQSEAWQGDMGESGGPGGGLGA